MLARLRPFFTLVATAFTACGPSPGPSLIAPPRPIASPSPPPLPPPAAPSIPRAVSQLEGMGYRFAAVINASPTGSWLLHTTSDEVLVRDLEAGDILYRAPISVEADAMGISPDGRVLCVATHEYATPVRDVGAGTFVFHVSAFDLTVGRPLWRQQVPAWVGQVYVGASRCVAASRGDHGATLRAFELATGAPIPGERTTSWALAATTGVFMSPNGAWALAPFNAGSESRPMKEWVVLDAQTFEPLKILGGQCAAFDAAGNLHWSGGQEFAAESPPPAPRAGPPIVAGPGACQAVLPPPPKAIELSATLDGRRMVIRSPPPIAVHLVDTASARVLRTLDAIVGEEQEITAPPGGGELLFYARGAIYRWDITSAALPRLVAAAPGGSAELSVSPDGRIVGHAVHGKLLRWSLPDGAPLAPIPLPTCSPKGEAYQLAYRSDGAMALVCSDPDEKGTALYEAPPGEKTSFRRVSGPVLTMPSIAWGTIGGRPLLAVKDLLRGAQVVDPDHNRLLFRHGDRAGLKGSMFGGDISPDGARVAIALNHTPERGVWLLDATTGKPVEHFVPLTFLTDGADVGWMGQGRRLWLLTAIGPEFAFARRLLQTFDLSAPPPADGPKALTTSLISGSGKVRADPRGRYFVHLRADERGFSIIPASGGDAIVSVGFRGNGAVSFGADGTFACEGEGCGAVRCTVGGKSLAADAPDCARLRRSGPYPALATLGGPLP